MNDFNSFIKNFSIDAIMKVVFALLIVVGGILLTKLIVHLFAKGMKRTNVDESLVAFFKRCIRVLCYILIAISALTTIGISTTGIIASFSAFAATCAGLSLPAFIACMSFAISSFTRLCTLLSSLRDGMANAAALAATHAARHIFFTVLFCICQFSLQYIDTNERQKRTA